MNDPLSRDSVPVRCLKAEDLADVVRIDRKITGRDQTGTYRRKFDEALHESAIRVSLVAEIEQRPVGFIMARVDFGGFGQTEPVAVMDTIGVDPGFSNQAVGKALLSQLLANLAALRVERVETQVARENFDLLRFFYRCGFGPSQNLAFHKHIT
jgi:ribosomal protein S18 acetylase RimI-like enzyme